DASTSTRVVKLTDAYSSVVLGLTRVSLFLLFAPPATPEISPLSLHDALPISRRRASCARADDCLCSQSKLPTPESWSPPRLRARSEEHTSELQSPDHLVCRLLLEKKNIISTVKK